MTPKEIGVFKQHLAYLLRKQPQSEKYNHVVFEHKPDYNFLDLEIAAIQHCNKNGILPFPTNSVTTIIQNLSRLFVVQSLVIGDDVSISDIGMSIYGREKDTLRHTEFAPVTLTYKPFFWNSNAAADRDFALAAGADARLVNRDIYKNISHCWVDQNSSCIAGGNITRFTALYLFPCGYRFSLKLTEGIGPSGMRKRTKGKTISFISHIDRIYKQLPEHEKTGQSRSPHYRRPHIRHLWKNAGIDRMSLPEDPIKRLQIVHAYQVKRVWVKESYPGFRDTELGKGLLLQQAQDDMELP